MKRHLIIIILLFLSIAAAFGQDNPNETIIKDVSIIDGNGNEPFLNSIKISNGKIKQISNFNELGATDSTNIIDGTGKYLIPGLIDSHVHIQFGGDEN